MIPAKQDLTIQFAHVAYRLAERFAARDTGIAHFQTWTQEETLARVAEADVLVLFGFWRRCGLSLLARFEDKGPYRLVCLTAHDLKKREAATLLVLLGDDRERRLETTLDELSERFGDNGIRLARDRNQTTVMNDFPNRDPLNED